MLLARPSESASSEALLVAIQFGLCCVVTRVACVDADTSSANSAIYICVWATTHCMFMVMIVLSPRMVHGMREDSTACTPSFTNICFCIHESAGQCK